MNSYDQLVGIRLLESINLRDLSYIPDLRSLISVLSFQFSDSRSQEEEEEEEEVEDWRTTSMSLTMLY
jgi:hypothetical protein